MKKTILRCIILLLVLVLAAAYPAAAVSALANSLPEEVLDEALEETLEEELPVIDEDSDKTDGTDDPEDPETDLEETGGEDIGGEDVGEEDIDGGGVELPAQEDDLPGAPVLPPPVADEITAVYDPQPETAEEVQAIIDAYEEAPEEERVKPRWEFEVDSELMPEGYYCGFVEGDEEFPFPYFTFFGNEKDDEQDFMMAPLEAAAPVYVGDANAFLNALSNQADEITLTDNITITIATAPLPLYNLASQYDIVKDLTINGQGFTLTLNYSLGNYSYFRLTGSGTLRLNDITLESRYTCTSNFFSVYNPTSASYPVWNAEFNNVTFKGGGLIGQYDLTGARGSIGDITFSGTTDLTFNLESNFSCAAVHGQSITFMDDALITANNGLYMSKGMICAAGDIVFFGDVNAVTTGTGALYGLFSSENGCVYFYSDLNLDITQASVTRHRALIKGSGVMFWGEQTTIGLTNTLANGYTDEYAIVYATDVELGMQGATSAQTGSTVTITASADTAFFKSPGSTAPLLHTDLAYGSFTVNPYTTVSMSRERTYTGSLLSNKSLIDGYENFYFKESCNFVAQAVTNTAHLTPTGIIRSKKTYDFILEEGADVELTSIPAAAAHETGFTDIILKKPDNGRLNFTVMHGASLKAEAFGTHPAALHGLAPIQILGNANQMGSTSAVTIYGSLTTSASNGNGWYYEYTTSHVSGKDSFIVDGGTVNLISNCAYSRGANHKYDLVTAQYAAFDNYSKNELELLVTNGGYMLVKSDGWRAMGLSGGDANHNPGTGIKQVNVTGSGWNDTKGTNMPSTLVLEGGQFAIDSEAYVTLYINVTEGGQIYSNNNQDSNIYTSGRAVYTVSGEGSRFEIRKSGIASDGATTGRYGAIYHHDSFVGPLEIYVESGGHMYVENNNDTSAAISAQLAHEYVHLISVTGDGSYLGVISNNTTDSMASTVITSNANYPIGAIAFAYDTSGDIYVTDGGSLYAESHNPFSQTIALGGYGPDGLSSIASGTLYLDNPGSIDIRNDSYSGGDVRATALRGRSYVHHSLNLNTITTSISTFTDPALTISAVNTDITVYKTNGSDGTPSYVDWHVDTIIRAWKSASFTAGNIATTYNIFNGDGSDAANGASAGSSENNSFSLHTYGRIAAGGAATELYRITYDGNGGETHGHETEYYSGLYIMGTEHEVIDNHEIGFHKPLWATVSWNTSPDGGGDTYYPGDKLNVSGNITLYAIWETDQNIEFHLPLTGGDGSFPFKAFGALLLGVSVICALIYTRGHKSRADRSVRLQKDKEEHK